VFGVVLQEAGIEVLPVLAVATFVALAVAAWRLPRGLPSSAVAATPGARGVLVVMRQPAVGWFFASVFLTVLAHVPLYTFFSLYLVENGFGKTTVGLLWAVSVVGEIAFFWTQGHWFARWNAQAWLMAAAAAAVLRFAATAAFGDVLAVLVLAQVLHALTFAAHHASCIAVVDRHFAGALRGRGQALYATLGYGVSGVLGGLASGAISQRFGLSALFAAAAVVSVAALGCAWRSRVLAAQG
jgi:PPP family 3-phenylpropionic acid transporter